MGRYLRVRSREKLAGRPELWLAEKNRGPLTSNGIHQMLRRRVDAAGILGLHAHLAGISVSRIRELVQQDRGGLPGTQRVRPSTARRVLGIGIDVVSQAPHSRIDATGTRRRLQALIAIGWPPELLAAQLGRRPKS